MIQQHLNNYQKHIYERDTVRDSKATESFSNTSKQMQCIECSTRLAALD